MQRIEKALKVVLNEYILYFNHTSSFQKNSKAQFQDIGRNTIAQKLAVLVCFGLSIATKRLRLLWFERQAHETYYTILYDAVPYSKVCMKLVIRGSHITAKPLGDWQKTRLLAPLYWVNHLKIIPARHRVGENFQIFLTSYGQFSKAKEESILTNQGGRDGKEGNTRRDPERHPGTKYQLIH